MVGLAGTGTAIVEYNILVLTDGQSQFPCKAFTLLYAWNVYFISEHYLQTDFSLHESNEIFKIAVAEFVK
jgi:hypothetical protein